MLNPPMNSYTWSRLSAPQVWLSRGCTTISVSASAASKMPSA